MQITDFENKLDLNVFETQQAMAMKKLYSHSFLTIPCPKFLHLATNPAPYFYK